jgi:hypothetical protein
MYIVCVQSVCTHNPSGRAIRSYLHQYIHTQIHTLMHESQVFGQMETAGVKPNLIAYSSAIAACEKVCMHAHVCVGMYVHMCVCICVYIHICVCV